MDLLMTERQRQEASVPSAHWRAASPTAMLGGPPPTPKTIPWLHGVPGKAAGGGQEGTGTRSLANLAQQS